MKDDSPAQANEKGKNPRIPLMITTIYASLYLLLLLSFLLFENPDYRNITPDGIFVSFAFVVFVAGYYASWKNHFVAGIIFIVWWGIVWYPGLYVAETDKGAGVVMGITMFIVGILFIVHWYRKKAVPEKNEIWQNILLIFSRQFRGQSVETYRIASHDGCLFVRTQGLDELTDSASPIVIVSCQQTNWPVRSEKQSICAKSFKNSFKVGEKQACIPTGVSHFGDQS